MIVPHQLVPYISSIYKLSSRFVPTSLQKTLNDFIQKDYLNKHLRNIIEVSEERKNIFSESVELNFGNKLRLEVGNTGLHTIGILNKDKKATDVAKKLSKHGITAHPLDMYYIGDNLINGLVLGHCSVNNRTIKNKVALMAKYFNEID